MFHAEQNIYHVYRELETMPARKRKTVSIDVKNGFWYRLRNGLSNRTETSEVALDRRNPRNRVYTAEKTPYRRFLASANTKFPTEFGCESVETNTCWVLGILWGRAKSD